MISLLSAGDFDVLRQATRASTVFWDRVRNSPIKVTVLAVFTGLLVLLGALMFIGTQLHPWLTAERVSVVFAPLLLFWLGYAGWSIYKFMPDRNDRIVMSLRHFVRNRIDPLEAALQSLSDDELRARTEEFRRRLADGEAIDDIRPEAYAVVREASRRARAHRHFECQLIGGKVLEDGNVAEMRTGEGKTIVCYCANYLKALQGRKVHMVTVNDYLVRRDADFCRPIFELLGMTVGTITSDVESYGEGAKVRQQNYACDITYGTNSEFGFDYLRDNMKHNPADLVLKDQDFAVVDEVDSILIDEARTPLIISGPAHDDVRVYQSADNVARSLIKKQQDSIRETQGRIDEIAANMPRHIADDNKARTHYLDGVKKFRSDPMWLSSEEADAIGHRQYFVVEMDRKSAHMTEAGAKAAQQELGIGSFYDGRNMNWPHYIDNALRAHVTYQRDKEYVVQDGQVVIVDEFTGRLMQGRQWSDGLHQAVEAKERIQIKQQTQTFATITLQNLFKMYKQLAGMTGTAMTEAEEFNKIYRLDVVAIPTNKPIRRVDFNDKIYKSAPGKYDKVVEEIHSYSQTGVPSDPWSQADALRSARKLIKQRVHRGDPPPDADAQVAMIEDALKTFADGDGDAASLEPAYRRIAGDLLGPRPVLVGTVSVETSEKLSNMLTRTFGIDHEVLNAKNHAREAEIVAKAGQQHERVVAGRKQLVGNVTIATNMAGRGTDIVLGPGVADIGGLHVVGTERHESRRIDNQLRGRCGRQGDPGSSRFFLSFEDELIKLFMGEWMLKMLNRFGLEEGVPVEAKAVTRGIANAQKKVEERNFNIRKNLLEYDEVPDQQRKSFYDMRRRVLLGRDLSGFIWEFIDDAVADACTRYLSPDYAKTVAAEWVNQHLGFSLEPERLDVSEFQILCEQIRELGETELRGHVQRNFGEYIDPDSDPEDWDVRGLINWVSQYGLTLTQREVRELDATELQERIIEAATRKLDETDLTPLEPIIGKNYGRSMLAGWAKDKFGVDIDLDKLTHPSLEETESVIREKMREVYRQREIEYPAATCVQYALQKAGQNANVFYEQVAKWANLKFQNGWTYEHFVGKSPRDVYRELREENGRWLNNGRIDAEIDEATQGKSPDEVLAWAKERFGRVIEMNPIDQEGDLREQLRHCGYEMLRYELTRLEQAVLLQTFDAAWKDHMYAMDLLRHSIGLRGYGEQDPKIAFKREGTRLFNETLASIRSRVTDVIFKVGRVDEGDGQAADAAPVAAGAVTDSESAPPRGLTAVHGDATGAAYQAARTPQPEAAVTQGGPGGAPGIPIRREAPKVGRNDPCPCGSGKKYKQCHGKKG